MAGVFISYRRDDSAGWAGRLATDLEGRFGADTVFQDIEAIGAGEDFIQAIDRALGSCSAALVLIGPDWAAIKGRNGARRLDNPADTVREMKTSSGALMATRICVPSTEARPLEAAVGGRATRRPGCKPSHDRSRPGVALQALCRQAERRTGRRTRPLRCPPGTRGGVYGETLNLRRHGSGGGDEQTRNTAMKLCSAIDRGQLVRNIRGVRCAIAGEPGGPPLLPNIQIQGSAR